MPAKNGIEQRIVSVAKYTDRDDNQSLTFTVEIAKSDFRFGNGFVYSKYNLKTIKGLLDDLQFVGIQHFTEAEAKNNSNNINEVDLSKLAFMISSVNLSPNEDVLTINVNPIMLDNIPLSKVLIEMLMDDAPLEDYQNYLRFECPVFIEMDSLEFGKINGSDTIKTNGVGMSIGKPICITENKPLTRADQKILKDYLGDNYSTLYKNEN